MNARNDPVLRSLDTASASLTAEERERAVATLERIVASPTTESQRSAALAPVPRATRRPWRSMILVPATALVLTLAMIVGSVVVQRGGDDDAAYASWTTAPAPVAGADLDAAADACRDHLHRYYADTMDADRAKLALAERRGEYVVALYHTDYPDMSANCLMHNPPGSAADVVDSGAGGSTGPALKAPPRGFTEGAIGGFARGAIARGEIDESRAFSITDGAVGEEVTGVTIHAGDFTVEASVQNGRYAAWWPGPAFEGGPPEPSGRGGPEPILTYDLTLTDGSVIRDAQPTFPS